MDGKPDPIAELHLIDFIVREGDNLHTLLDAIPECVKMLTAEGAIRYVNRSGLESLGAERTDEVIGLSIFDLISPEYHNTYREAVADAFAGIERTVVYETAACNSRALRWVRCKTGALRDAQGAVRFMLAITRDITERKRLAQRLEDYEIQLRTVIDSAPEGVVLHSRDGRIMDANPAARSMMYLQSETGAGESMFSVIAARHHSPYQILVAQVFFGKKARIELQTNPARGARRWLEIHAAPLHNSRAEVIGLLGMVQDITERKTREVKLTERQMSLAHVHRLNVTQELARLIAHEVNQPLCAISSYAEMCRDSLGAGVSGPAIEQLAELIDLIGHHAARLNDVIRKMRTKVRKRPLQREYVDVVRLIAEVTELFEPVFRKHEIVVKALHDPDLAPVLADPIEIEQVLVSLTRNSIEALSRVKGLRMFEIRVSGFDTAVLVGIRDNGPGIPDEVRERVLKPYFSNGDTFGLGLPLSRLIIELHGGKLWIDKSSEQGASVHFSLPVNASPERSEAWSGSQPYT